MLSYQTVRDSIVRNSLKVIFKVRILRSYQVLDSSPINNFCHVKVKLIIKILKRLVGCELN